MLNLHRATDAGVIAMASYEEFEAWCTSTNDPWYPMSRYETDSQPEFGVQFIGDDPLPPLPEPEKFVRRLS